MKTRIVNYKGYVIRSEEGEEKGLFWRNPLQKVVYDAYYPEAMFSAWGYLDKIKKPLYRFFQIVLGNKEVLKNIEEWSKSCDWGGFNANILCSPIYFKRNYRKLTAISCENSHIVEIHSYGYESEFNDCSGACSKEHTVFILSNGKKMKSNATELYNFTYEHIVKELIDSQK